MKRIKLTLRQLLVAILGVLVLIAVVLSVMLLVNKCSTTQTPIEVPVTDGIERLESIMLGSSERMYGMDIADYEVMQGEIERGETFSKLLNGRFNLNIAIVNTLVERSQKVFPLKDMRAGNSFTAFLTPDSTETIKYLVYDKNTTEYVIFNCTQGEESVKLVKRDVTVREQYAEGVINSSLSATIAENNLPVSLANRLDNIFKWTIDFFALQKGDSFRVIYEDLMIDTVSIGVSKIYGAEFIHNGKSYLAVSFEQGEEVGYWDEAGVNLRKSFLRSPLSFQARISSKFGVRIHPIKRVRSQHNGVDYACPSGTPIHAVADGTVSFKGWDKGGGGNMLKINHSQNLVSGYLHMRGYASGIRQGSRVRQGDVIGYVGSTGMSTGPHLDFRIWKSGKPVDPTKMQSLPSNPIKPENKTAFNRMKEDVLKVMNEYKK